MSKNPLMVSEDFLASKALALMNEKENHKPFGCFK